MNQPSEQNRHRLCHLPISPASGIWRIAGPSRLGLLWLAPLLWLGVTPSKADPGNVELTISCGANGKVDPNGSVVMPHMSDITFTAHPDPHYHVAQWTVDNAPVATGGATFTLPNITADHWVGITFALDSYTVPANAGPGGSLSPTGAVAVVYGDQQSFSATPEAGCDVACWWLDGRVVQTGGTTFWLDGVGSSRQLRRRNVVNRKGTVLGFSVIARPAARRASRCLRWDGSRGLPMAL
jgi:hypothetical protein